MIASLGTISRKNDSSTQVADALRMPADWSLQQSDPVERPDRARRRPDRQVPLRPRSCTTP